MISWNPTTAQVISCDVFDTLLQRNHIAEPNRVRLIAERSAALLARDCKVAIAVNVLWRARMEVQRHAYRVLAMTNPQGEVAFAQMIDCMTTKLGLGAAEGVVLARAEIAVEQTQLKANRALMAWLGQRASEGVRIIAISDTWHDESTIDSLLAALAPGHPIAKVYTSADLKATKRSAAIFPLVAVQEGVQAGAFFHIGDDREADDLMARRAGLQVHRIQPPMMTLLARRINGISAKLRQIPQF